MKTHFTTLTINEDDTECINKALDGNPKYRQWDNTYYTDFDNNTEFSIRFWGVESKDLDKSSITPGIIAYFRLPDGTTIDTNEEEPFFGVWKGYDEYNDELYCVFVKPENPFTKVNVGEFDY